MSIDPIKLAVGNALAKQRHHHQDELEAMKDAHLKELRDAKKPKRLELVRSAHPLKRFVEDAMARAGVTSFDETEPVWRQLVVMADQSDSPPYVCGYSTDRQAIMYQGKKYDRSYEADYFDRAALAQLFRRQKAHASPRGDHASPHWVESETSGL